jgi:hypothetical protein
VLASTQDLHVKINDLSHRVRSLEDALRSAYSVVSEEPHPLLTDDLLKIKHPIQRDSSGGSQHQASSPPPDDRSSPPDAHIVDAVGSLSVSDAGRTQYFGHSANSWVCCFYSTSTWTFADDHSPVLLTRMFHVLHCMAFC